MEQKEPSAGLTELIGRALTDEEFRQRLYEDRQSTIADFELTRTDLKALDELSIDELEEQAARLGGRASITIKVVISKSF